MKIPGLQWIARSLSTLVGDFSWRPPGWLRWLCGNLWGSVHGHPQRWIFSLLGLGLLTVGGMKGWDWWEAHRPRPKVQVVERKTTIKLDKPGLAEVDDEGLVTPCPLRLTFSQSAAPLDLIGKDLTEGQVLLSPVTEGTWKWASDKVLTFLPAKDWPAGTNYEVKLQPAALAKETILESPVVTFASEPLVITLDDAEFYTDVQDPTIHQVVTKITSSHPLDKADLEKHIGIEVLGGSPVFTWKDKTPAKPFNLVEGKHQKQFWIRTTRIAVPDKEDFVKVSLSEGITSLNGGAPTSKAFAAKVRVPDALTGFLIKGVDPTIVRTEEGEPQQFVFIDTEGYVAGPELAKHLEAWLLPLDKPATAKSPMSEDHDWSVGEVTVDVLKLAKRIPLKHVEAEAAVTSRHSFQFLVEEPGRLYLRVPAGLQALGGFRLAKEWQSVISTPDFPQEIEILGKGGLLALNGERKLSIKSRGTSHIRYTVARVPAGQVNHLVNMTEGDFESPQFQAQWLFNEENIARISRTVQPVAIKNDYEANYSTFDFSPELQRPDASDPDASRGLFFITAQAVHPRTEDDGRPDEDEDDADPDWAIDQEVNARRFVLMTDLGLLVKSSADQSTDVFVQSIQRGEPVAGVQVQVLAKNGEFLDTQITGADGHVKFPPMEHLKKEKEPVALIARLGTDLSFFPAKRPDRLLDFSRFDADGILASEREALDAYLFTERGVYRPGDTVHLAAIVRQRDWQGKLSGLPVEIQVLDSHDVEVDNQRLALSDDGYITWDCATDEANPTGTYQATLYLIQPKGDDEEGRRQFLGRTAFRVEDFQPDRMKLATEFNTPADAGWVNGRDVRATAKVQTLFGFAAADRRLKAKMNLSPADFNFPQHPGYVFHNRQDGEETPFASKTIELGELRSDASGKAEFDLDLKRFAGASFRMSLLVEAFEADGGRSVRSGGTLLVSPFPYVVGYKPDGDLDYIGKDSARNIHLIAVAPDLKGTAADGLTYRLIQRSYVSVLTKRDDDSYAYVSTKRETVSAEGPFELGANGADYALPTAEPGEFRFELRDSGNQVICACPFTVVGKGDSSRSLERNAELDVKLARGNWNSGEPLELSITAPYTGAGLITIERDHLLGWQWFKSSTTSSVQHITVPEGLESTGYVNVSFVRALDSPEVFLSPLSYAVQPFTANPDKRKLQVNLDVTQIAKPGEPLKIGHRTARPSHIIVYAVDEGIHQITNYPRPDPLSHFMRKRSLEVETAQLLDLILPEYSLITRTKAFGGDEDDAPKIHLNPFKRRKEPPVVFWSGVIESGPNRAEVTYDVPDYFAGSLKIMAVAVDNEAIGTAETQSTIRGPFVLTPNVPTFAAPGDEFTVSLTVANNLEGAASAAPVTVTCNASAQVEVIESPQGPVDVAPGKEATTRFKLRAKEELGGAELVFAADGGGQRLERHATLSIRPAMPFETRVQSGYFRLASQDVKVERDMHPQFRRQQASVSVLPLGLALGLEGYLRDYPHGCSEQITSRAMSRLLLSGEADFGFDRAEASAQLNDAFYLLASRQAGDGGFGYWDARHDSGFDFLSVYVTHFLTEARDAGFAVPEDLLDGARDRMRTMAKQKITTLQQASIQAGAIYLLTRNGEVTTNYLLNLRDSLETLFKDTWRGDLTGAYLAATYAMLQKQDEGQRLMEAHRSAEATPAPERWWGGYADDPQVRNALSLALLCRHFPDMANAIGYDQLSIVTDPITRGRFNTISSACTILALKSYSQLAAKSGLRVSISALGSDPKAQPQLLSPDTDGLLTRSFPETAKLLRFSRIRPDGAPDLGAFYQVTESGYDQKISSEIVRDGLEVIRDLLGADGNPATLIATGESITVRIRVRNLGDHNLSDIAVMDLLPGGFEVEPGNLVPGRSTMPGAEFTEVREDRNVFFTSLTAGGMVEFSYRIKPVCAGSFQVPPIFAECMYDRGIHARAGGGAIEVKPVN